MAGRGLSEGYMHWSSGNRFQPFGLTHNPIMGNSMMAQGMMNSSMYRNIHSLKTEMPSDVLELFKANEIGFVRPVRKVKCRQLDPLSAATFNILDLFPEPEMDAEDNVPAAKPKKINKKKLEKEQAAKAELEEKLHHWNPFEENLISDPYKTLVVARLKYETTERTVKLEFEKYGNVKSVKLITDKEGKSRGYAFVEYEKREDFVNAYKNAHLRRIDGRRVIVDFEKGRTIIQWRPRRLGGGDGTLRLTRQEVLARERARNIANERKEARRRERDEDKKEHREERHRDHSRSRSRERKERRKERQCEREKEKTEHDRDRNRDRGHDREKDREADRDRGRDRDREHDRHQSNKDLERERHEKKSKADMEVEPSREKKEKKEKKEKSRQRSHRKEKKEKKEKKERKEYVALNVPVDEFR